MLLLTPPEGAPTAPAEADVLADAKAEARSWSTNTRRPYVAGWKDFTNWSIEHRCAGLLAAPADIGRYIEHLVEMEGQSLAAARLRLKAVKATARIQQIDTGKRRRKETETLAAMRAAVDVALLEVIRDGLLRRSEVAALRWGDLEFHTDGSGRLHVARSKTDQSAEGAVLFLGPAAVDALLAICPHEAVIDPDASIFARLYAKSRKSNG